VGTTINLAPTRAAAKPATAVLDELRAFVHRERDAALDYLLQTWSQPLQDKLAKGLSQRFLRLEAGAEPGTINAWPDHGESRFREGDLLCLHLGSPYDSMLARGVNFESEEEGYWVLRVRQAAPTILEGAQGRTCYADPDQFDLTRFYEDMLDELAQSIPPSRAHRTLLPLLAGRVSDDFDPRDFEEAERAALAAGLNAGQAEAVGKALAAEQVVCIQGPPGTGKTRVLALAARLLVERGERVLVTSHTHTAINNALNKIAELGVPLAKVGRHTQTAGLDAAVERAGSFAEWRTRPLQGGYVVGATPFATCTQRLDNCQFDTVIFDEASQVTVPLALMAMRRGERFVFIGDQKQLPPVLLAKSILHASPGSIFARFTSANADSVMLTDTYRMNRELASWPSNAFYAGRLRPAGPNRDRILALLPPAAAAPVLREPASLVFVPTRDRTARSRNASDAQLVATICAAAIAGGLAPAEIGIVTPYRAHGRAVRRMLERELGWEDAKRVVADTVERMQGQERELVVLSLATGDLGFLGAVAEFFFQPERLNVSVTRARTKLVIVGPELPDEFYGGHDELARWIGLYRSLIAAAKRVEP
jgi:DNA replication ATP-dependent helicase Dna2